MEYSIYNTDCIEYMKTIENNTCDCIITDLPFNIVTNYGEKRAKYKNQLRKLDKSYADEKTFELDVFLKEVSRISNGGIYLFCGYNQISEIFNYFNNHKGFMVRVGYWHKTNPSPMNGQHMYLNAVEPFVFAKKRKTKFFGRCSHNWMEFDQNEEYLTFMTNYKEVITLPTIRKKIHPTEKPTALLSQMILDSTEEYDTVYDFCAGSMSTGEASLILNRFFCGVEINEDAFKNGENRIKEVYDKLNSKTN